MTIVYALAGLIGLVIILLLLIKPRIFTALSIFLTLLQFDWFVRYYSAPAIIKRATLVLVGLLGIRICLHFLVKNPTIRRQYGTLVPVFLLALFFCFLTLISNLYNEESLLIGFYSLRYYFVGFVLTLALYLYYSEDLTIDRFNRHIVILALIQLPVCVLKYFAAGGGSKYTLDSVSGTFAGYGELVVCQVIAIGIVMTDRFVYKKNTLPKFNTFLTCIVLIAPLLLSKSRSASVFVAIIVLFVLFYSLFKRRSFISAIKQISASGFIGIVFISLFYIFFWQAGEYDIEKQFNPDFAYEYYMHYPILDSVQLKAGADPRMGRFRAITTAWEFLNEDTIHRIVGYGAGSVSEASFIGQNGRYFQKIGPLAGLDRNQFSKTLFEFGYSGLLAFFIFFFTLGRRLDYIPNVAGSIKRTYTILVFTLVILSSYSITLESYFFSFIIAYFIATAHAELVNNSEE
ncbi:MAG: hypothetical protein K0U68_08145 [Gammaproteobacteria bacterium]|nr:hypothetical protein [Gammaproteobacteria bacterium]